MDAITEPVLRTLAGAGSLRDVQVVADGEAWYVVVLIGMEERVVASQRHQRRTWRSLDTVTQWLRERVGVAAFQVHSAHHSNQKGAVA